MKTEDECGQQVRSNDLLGVDVMQDARKTIIYGDGHRLIGAEWDESNKLFHREPQDQEMPSIHFEEMQGADRKRKLRRLYLAFLLISAFVLLAILCQGTG